MNRDAKGRFTKSGRKHRISAAELGNAFRNLGRYNLDSASDLDYEQAYDTRDDYEDTMTYPRDENSDDYDDDDYDPYRDFGTEVENDPNWGYDNFDTFDDDNRRGFQVFDANPRDDDDEEEDYSDKPIPEWRNSKANKYVDAMKGYPGEKIDRFMNDFMDKTPRERLRHLDRDPNNIRYYNDGTRTIGTHSESDPPEWAEDNDGLEEYLNYLDQYDRGEIDNYQMSKIQRDYANKSFWKTFSPSPELIEQYGSGDRSTRWPMFEKRNGRWRPVFWRND